MDSAVTAWVTVLPATACTAPNSPATAPTATTPTPGLPRMNATSYSTPSSKASAAAAENWLASGRRNFTPARQPGGSPSIAAEQVELRLLRHQHHRRAHVPLRDLAFSLHRLFRLLRIRKLRPRLIGRRQLRKRLAHARLGRDVSGNLDAGYRGRGRLGNDGRLIGIEDHALRPFALGMNANDRQVGIRPHLVRQFRKIRIRDEKQREQR